MHRSPVVRTVATLCLAVTTVGAASCAGGDRSQGAAVEPVAAPDAAADGSPTPAHRGPSDEDDDRQDTLEQVPDAGAGEALGDAAATASDEATRSLVQTVLDRYDAALTTVAADPLAATPGGPGLAAWHSAVVEGGSFSTAMLSRLVDRATHESTVVRPGPDGRSYRHHALQAVADGDAVSFTWCGHAPGLGVDSATDEIVDDAVALSHGTGELRHDGTDWRLLTLDAFDLDVAAPGTPDPCPDEVAAARAAR